MCRYAAASHTSLYCCNKNSKQLPWGWQVQQDYWVRSPCHKGFWCNNDNGNVEYHAQQWEKIKIKTTTFWKLPESLRPGFLPVSISFRGRFTWRTPKREITTLLGGYNFEKTKKWLASTKKRPSTSSESLNYQGRKKIYSGPQYQQLRQNQQNSLLRYQKRNWL